MLLCGSTTLSSSACYKASAVSISIPTACSVFTTVAASPTRCRIIREDVIFAEDLQIEVSGQLFVGENAELAKAIETGSGISASYVEAPAISRPFTTSFTGNIEPIHDAFDYAQF